MIKNLPLSEVYRHLEPGPVVLTTTARNGRSKVMVRSWHMMMAFEPPLVGCVVSGANHSFSLLRKTRECVLEVVKAWIDRAKGAPRTLHHRGFGTFAVDGEILRLRSRKP